MTRVMLLAVLAASIGAGRCGRSLPPGAPPGAAPDARPATGATPADDSVYGALLGALAARERVARVVVEDTTWRDLAEPAAREPVLRHVDALADTAAAWRAARDDFDRRNSSLARVAPRVLPASVRLDVVSGQTNGTASPAEVARFWADFAARHGGANGVLTLSRPGRTPDGDRVIVAVRRAVGPASSTGALYLLQRRRDGSWALVGDRVLWIS